MPFLNPVEMTMPSQWSVIERLQENKQYNWLLKYAFNINLKKIVEGDVEVAKAFEAMAKAIAVFEKPSEFNRFYSKFDYEALGVTAYNESE